MVDKHAFLDDEDPDAIRLEDAYNDNAGDLESTEEAGLINNNASNQSRAYQTPPSSGWRRTLDKIKWRAGQHAAGSPPNSTSSTLLTRSLRRLGFIAAAFLMCLGVLQLVNIAHGAYVALFPGHKNHVVTEWEEVGLTGAGLKHYPTDFTRDVLTIPCHSHNDYWRAVPLYSGVSAGCISTEADVWLLDGHGDELFVGHDESSLTRNRTLHSLYVGPLLEILDRQNPTTEFVDGAKTANGVFDTDPGQVFTLLIDLKTDGNKTFDAVVRALDPLRKKNYLSSVGEDGKVINRPLRVIGTGNTPFKSVLSAAQNPHKDIFFDAPIEEMAADGQQKSSEPSPRAAPDYSPSNSYYASGSFLESIGVMWGWSLTASQLAKLRAQIKGAHEKGLKVRYWETPAWPVSRRNKLWEILVDEGADVLNVDDLKGAVEEDWRRAGGWWRK